MTKKVYKSAETGRFVSKEFAAENPATTYKQTAFSIDDALSAISERYTPEMREEDEQAQIKLKGTHPAYLDPNSYESRVFRAQRQERDIRKQIDFLKTQAASEAKSNLLYQALNRLSELLAEQGLYEEAAEVCPEDPRRERYKMFQAAIERDDNDVCACEDEIIEAGGSRIRRNTRHKKKKLVSKKHKSMVILEVCRKCTHANAK